MAQPLTWIRSKERTLSKSCYRAYSVLFWPLAALVLIGLPISGRELIWNVDGLNQYYPFFLYEGQWLRGIAFNLLSGNGLQIPLWEWCSGYGADIPTTFDVFLDPLNLVSAITPAALSEWVFQLLVIVRMYLAGLAFVFYAQTRTEDRTGTVLGALLYALGGSALTGVCWSSGLHALMLFPVVLAGAERVLQGKRPLVFVVSLAALAVVSYYFTYMASILLVAYLAVRVAMVERDERGAVGAGRFIRWVGVFAGLAILSIAIAAFALVPAVFSILGMERVTAQSTVVPLLYDPSYYVQLTSAFLSIVEVGSDTSLGFGGMGFFGCVLLFASARAGRTRHDSPAANMPLAGCPNRELRIAFVVLTVCMALPSVGSFFNGLNYATNRWAWAYALCVSLILARMTPTLLDLGDLARVLVKATAGYALLLVVGAWRTEANVAGLAALLAALLFVLAAQRSEAPRALLVGALALTLAVNGFYFLATEEDGKGKEQVPLTMALAKLTRNSANSLAARADDPTWWRYDGGQVYAGAGAPIVRIRNNSLVLGLQGADFYNSVYNDRVDTFHTELGIAGDYINFSYNDLQGRSDLMALLGVKYYLYRDDGTDALPFGFNAQNTRISDTIMNVNFSLVQADVQLPLAYAFDKAIRRQDYLALSPAKRQQALLQAAVLEDDTEHTAFVPAESLEFEDRSLPFEVSGANGAEVQDGRFLVAVPGATVTLALAGTAQADTYLYVRGLHYEGVKPSGFVNADELANMPWHYRAQLLLQDLSYAEPVYYQVSCKSDASPMTGYITNCSPRFHMYGGKDTWLVNLGYADAPATTVTLTFDQAGAYTFDELQVVSETHAARGGWLASRASAAMSDARQGCNRLTGSVDLDRPQVLLLTVAYSRGWQAFVDGTAAPLLPADTGFMALDLPAGHHDIELRYRTPGLMAGLAISAASVVALILLNRFVWGKPAHKDTGKGQTA